MGKPGKSAFLLCISLFVFIDTNAQTSVCSKHLKIQESTQRHWNPGVVRDNADQAGGLIYKVKIKVKKGSDIAFQKLIIENVALDVELKQNGNRVVSGHFQKGDDIILFARTDKQKSLNTADEEIVSTIQNKKAIGAVLYTSNDKKYIHLISNFTVTQNSKTIQ